MDEPDDVLRSAPGADDGRCSAREAAVSRRSFLAWMGATSMLSAPGCDRGDPTSPELPTDTDPLPFDFLHGVASGDPELESILLWTRITPNDGTSAAPADVVLEVDWILARDEALADPVAHGSAATDAQRDFTVKVTAEGLEPNRTYYYRFHDPWRPDVASPVGRTKTLPAAGVKAVRFAATSCTAYSMGFFNSYAHMALRDDLQFVMHLGDYIYEYGAEFYNDPELERPPEPQHEILTLTDYRTRYAQYRSDPDLQAAHRAHPFVAIWDDHEFVDDIHDGGSPRHQEEWGGSFALRRAAAMQAYLEWMPVRETMREGRVSLYRKVVLGDLADVLVLDTRLQERDPPGPATAADERSSLLGPAQEAWLHEELSDSSQRGAPWRLLVSSVVMMSVEMAGYTLDYQSWDGYPGAKRRLLDHLHGQAIDNVVVLSGDFHAAVAAENARDPFDSTVYDPATGQGALLPEITVTSATSPPVGRFVHAAGFERFMETHPHVRFLDVHLRGYVIVDVNDTGVTTRVWRAETTGAASPDHAPAVDFHVRSGSPRVEVEPL